MNEKQTKTVPDHFRFKANASYIEYEAKRYGSQYKLSWESPSYGYSQSDYDVGHVEICVGNGSWQIVSVIEDEITQHVNESAYPTGEALLRIKSFTEAVLDALVTINSGTYEVHYANRIAFANTDEELDELMDAICVFDAAINK